VSVIPRECLGMTKKPEKPKTRKAAPKDIADLDPIFGLIAAHKALIKEVDRLEANYATAKARAEKSMENGRRRPIAAPGRVRQSSRRFTINGTALTSLRAGAVCEWLGRSRKRWPE